MKIFTMESAIRQCKIDGLPYDVDLCFTVNKLVVEIDEDGYYYYDEEKHPIRQNLVENLSLLFLELILM